MTAKIFRNAFLIGFTVLLACILLFFFIMYSNYQAQAYDILEVEAGHISEGMQICGGEEYLASMQSNERIARRYRRRLKPEADDPTGIRPQSWKRTITMPCC